MSTAVASYYPQSFHPARTVITCDEKTKSIQMPIPLAYDLELWVSSAMLAITFPIMVAFAGFFDFWPLARSLDRHRK